MSPQQKLDQYLSDSPVLRVYAGDKKEEVSNFLRESLSTWIGQNNGQWPGRDQIEIAEQFFQNFVQIKNRKKSGMFASSIRIRELNSDKKDLIELIFGRKSDKTWEDFNRFSAPFLVDVRDDDEKSSVMDELLFEYLAFPTFTERAEYERFVEPYRNSAFGTKDALHIYKAFPTSEARGDFLEFCRAFLNKPVPSLFPMKLLLPVYQAFPEPGSEREAFFNFCRNYLDKADLSTQYSRVSDLLPVYRAFPILAERDAFLRFCEPFTRQVISSEFGSSSMDNKSDVLKHLLPIYQAFSTSLERSCFLNFCDTQVRKALSPIYETYGESLERIKSGSLVPYDPYVDKRSLSQKIDDIKYLLPIYKMPGRDGFLQFCEEYRIEIEWTDFGPYSMSNILPVYEAFPVSTDREDFLRFHANFEGKGHFTDIKEYIPIYRAFSTPVESVEFLTFCRPYLQRDFMSAVTFIPLSRAQDLLTVYKALPSPEGRAAFQDFCRPYVKREMAAGKPSLIKALLPVYLSDQMADFNAFIRPHLNRGIQSWTIRPLIYSYLPRHYLEYMRIDGALKTEQIVQPNRVQAMYETGEDGFLPALWGADPFLQQARNMFGLGFVNAHDFDAVYELDRPILWGQTDRYNDRASSTSHIIHNGEASKAHQTNEEVEDFIGYLDTTIAAGSDIQISRAVHLNGAQAVSIIKQMLGLEPKSGATSGGFAPYLSSSMYYAKPESPLGDEMLGRTWFYMKSLPGNSGDKDDYKKSVVLALLEAAEISVAGIDTHCQTRTTGELMKLVAQTLTGSNLRLLIAGTDLPAGHAEANIEARITAAPFSAQTLFRNIKSQSLGAVERVIQHYNETEGAAPPLWKLYEAYYDELYRRTKDGDDHYRADENILMRDDHGNLVRTLNRGTAQERVEVVYYQAEFQVFEKVFTDLMKKEFEEQRGLTY